MPGFLLTVQDTVLCAHTGKAQPTAANPRVTVGGQNTVISTASYAVAGCTLPPPPNGNGPCLTAQWTSAATRLTSSGQALLLFDSQATCTPTGTPLKIASTQTRVTGS